MKKEYEKFQIEVILFDDADIVRTSGEIEDLFDWNQGFTE